MATCQRHPFRKAQCGCMSLCSECRASFPHGCDCARKAFEREVKLQEHEEKQRNKHKRAMSELLERRETENKKQLVIPPVNYEQIIIGLERKLQLVQIEAEIEKNNMEMQMLAEAREKYDYFGKQLEKVSRFDSLPKPIEKVSAPPPTPQEMTDNIEMADVPTLPDRADNVTQDPGTWLTPMEDASAAVIEQEESPPNEASLPRKRVTATQKITKKAKELERKATWERLTRTTSSVKSLPKLKRGAGRSIARRGGL